MLYEFEVDYKNTEKTFVVRKMKAQLIKVQ